MGGYKKHDPAAYLVSWDAEGIVKAGYSAQQRWRKFTLRGARLVHVVTFPDHRDAFTLEGELIEILRSRGRRAFTSPVVAAPFLGHAGAGYLECFRMHPSNADALHECIARMSLAGNAVYGTNGTHELTNAVVLPGDISPVRYAGRAAKR